MKPERSPDRPDQPRRRSDNANLNHDVLSGVKPLAQLFPGHCHEDCKGCRPSANPPPMDDLGIEGFQVANWSEATEFQLVELALTSLDRIYMSAVKRIAAYGYSEETATIAVLKAGSCCGCKDATTNIVNKALVFLRNEKEAASSSIENPLEELRKLEKSTLEEMISMIREVHPFLSIGDAIWCLLIFDMNASRACVLGVDPLGSFRPPCPDGKLVPPLSSGSNSSNSATSDVPDPNVPGSNKVNASLSHSQIERSSMRRNSSRRRAAPNKVNRQSRDISAGKENPMSVSDYMVMQESYSQTPPSVKLTCNRRCSHGAGSKKEYSRQKTIRVHGSKTVLRMNTHSLDGLMLDRKGKTAPDSLNMALQPPSTKPSRAVGKATTQANVGQNTSFSTKSIRGTRALSTTNTEFPLPIPPRSSNVYSPESNHATEDPSCTCCTGTSSERNWGQYIPENKKEEMMVMLVPRAQELKDQLQEWSEWAEQKVRQATQRLRMDKADLQTLKQEKEELMRLLKEKETLEDNTIKKFVEMETALHKAREQVQKAQASVRSHEIENSILRQDMEASKVQTEAATCRSGQVLSRETYVLKKIQSSEREKVLLQEELAAEKRKMPHFQQQLEKAKEYHNQLQVRWRQEKSLKEEAIARANSEKIEREQIEVSEKQTEDTIRSSAENDTKKYEENIRSLDFKVAKLRLTTDSLKISQVAQESDAGVQRDRECVMCLTEEMSVVFLPCAHQVLCVQCNEIHKSRGMTECPSCRMPIQWRVCARSANS